jgi:SM-20-related protein
LGLRCRAFQTLPAQTVPARLTGAGNHRQACCRMPPCDQFKLVTGYDGEKGFKFQARAPIVMCANATAYADELSEAWHALGADLLSPDYRAAMSALTGCDLTEAPMEVNVHHYGPGCSLGAHKGSPDKLVTHVLYVKSSWNRSDGGCLRILRSNNLADMATENHHIVGNSAVLVRSEKSWHAVSPVVNDSAKSRRSMTITFCRPGAVTTMCFPAMRRPCTDTAPAMLSNESGTRKNAGQCFRSRRHLSTRPGTTF